MIISAGGVVIRTNVNAIRIMGRSTQGVSLMHLAGGDSVVAVSTTNGKKLSDTNGDAEDNGEDEEIEELEENGEIEVSKENGEIDVTGASEEE